MYEEEKAYLWGYRNAKKDFKRLKLELEEYETALTNISIDYSKEKVQSSPEADKLAGSIDKLNRLRNSCIDKATMMIDKMEEVQLTIDQVDDATLRDLLSRYYINEQTWETVAFETKCSWKGVHKRHARALEKVKKIIEVH